MIIKSYEVQKNNSNLSKYNFYLLYGENFGLKKDIKESIKLEVTKKDGNPEFLNLYEIFSRFPFVIAVEYPRPIPFANTKFTL